MNRGTLFVFLLALGLTSANLFANDHGERERAFVRSLELFDAAKTPDDYHESAKVLESILADGYRSGAVYYNLGNAYYRAGEYGRAILNYRKAKPYRPHDSYLTANLEQALVAAPGHLAEAHRPWWSHVFFWTNWLSYPMKVRTTFGLLCLAAFSMALAVLVRRPRLNVIAIGLITLAFAIGIDTALMHSEVEGSRRAVITGETIARKGTGNSYEAAFDQPLRDGAEFQVLGETSEWTFGHFENIGDGWIRNEFVAR
jgi:tetratricopeptide (TPR) repeat protein